MGVLLVSLKTRCARFCNVWLRLAFNKSPPNQFKSLFCLLGSRKCFPTTAAEEAKIARSAIFNNAYSNNSMLCMCCFSTFVVLFVHDIFHTTWSKSLGNNFRSVDALARVVQVGWFGRGQLLCPTTTTTTNKSTFRIRCATTIHSRLIIFFSTNPTKPAKTVVSC